MRRAPSSPPELPGYQYQRLLGAGGFSDVFLYEQRLPRRPVAVKVLLAEELTSTSRRAFIDEANLMAQLSAHPYIVTIHSADITADERPYIVMEYCAGPSLSERYKRERFSVADALRTGVRLSSAIATAHAAGILHRDIKPANVLTNDYGWPALTDFGISSAVEELPVHTTTSGHLDDENTGSTESQSVGMSVPWSPPEMFGDDPDPDVRSDLFSLSATIWTLLAGRTPFEVPNRPNGTLDLIGRIERGALTPMDRTDVPASLTAVLRKGMATRPADRYGSALEFARALQRVELELGYAPTTIEVPAIAGGEPVRETPADADLHADETRVRGVATVVAQPPVPRHEPSPAPSPVPSHEPGPEPARTRLRRTTTIDPSPPASSVPDSTVVRPRRTAAPNAAEDDATASAARADAATADAESGRAASGLVLGFRRRLPLLAGLGALVVIAVVAVAVATLGPSLAKSADPTPRPTGSSALVTGAPLAPKFLSAQPSADGTSVTFRFAPVPEAEGYRWAPSEQPDAQRGITEPIVLRTGVTPGQRVCVTIVSVVHGLTSDSTEACYP